MKKLGIILIAFMVLSADVTYAQKKKKKKAEAETPVVEAPPVEVAPPPPPPEPPKPVEPEVINGLNRYSVRPIHESDIMYKKTILRAVDLREKQNRPMFSRNKEITKLLIEAMERGDIKAYMNDSLEQGKQLTLVDFKERMKIPSAAAEMTAEEKEIALANGDSSALLSGQINYYFPKDIYQMEIKEDLIFDKQRSRMYYDIHAITFFIPADNANNIKGIQLNLASFAYKDIVALFKGNPNAIWFNPQNDAQHKSLADAFELRLFSSYIIKVSNPNDAYLQDIYGGDQKKGIMASQWAAFELLEYEHNLWEF